VWRQSQEFKQVLYGLGRYYMDVEFVTFDLHYFDSLCIFNCVFNSTKSVNLFVDSF
jgi:hypothetical protein